MKTIHFTIGSEGDNKAGSDKLEKQIRQLIAQKTGKTFSCEKCGSLDLYYEGLGKYVCRECGGFVFTNYGKVRECIENYGSMSVIEVMEKTGLTKWDIKQLQEEGSIILNTNGKVNII